MGEGREGKPWSKVAHCVALVKCEGIRWCWRGELGAISAGKDGE